MKETLYLSYWDERINYGDMLSPFILHKMSDKIVVRGNKMFEDNIKEMQKKIYFIGSIVHLVKENSIIYGSGCVTKNAPIKTGLDLQINAVRGPFTRNRFIESGYSCPEVYCDPGVLAPYLFGIEPDPIYEFGLLLHTTDVLSLDDDVLKRLKDEFHFIDIDDDPYLVTLELSKCEKIVSSSLHGLIVSEAMGIPTCYLRTYVRANDFKVHDYYLGTNRKIEDIKKYDLKCGQTIDKTNLSFTKPGKFDIEGLLNSAPFELSNEVSSEKIKSYYGDLIF